MLILFLPIKLYLKFYTFSSLYPSYFKSTYFLFSYSIFQQYIHQITYSIFLNLSNFSIFYHFLSFLNIFKCTYIFYPNLPFIPLLISYNFLSTLINFLYLTYVYHSYFNLSTSFI